MSHSHSDLNSNNSENIDISDDLYNFIVHDVVPKNKSKSSDSNSVSNSQSDQDEQFVDNELPDFENGNNDNSVVANPITFQDVVSVEEQNATPGFFARHKWLRYAAIGFTLGLAATGFIALLCINPVVAAAMLAAGSYVGSAILTAAGVTTTAVAVETVGLSLIGSAIVLGTTFVTMPVAAFFSEIFACISAASVSRDEINEMLNEENPDQNVVVDHGEGQGPSSQNNVDLNDEFILEDDLPQQEQKNENVQESKANDFANTDVTNKIKFLSGSKDNAGDEKLTVSSENKSTITLSNS
jgi:hypothetical protein